MKGNEITGEKSRILIVDDHKDVLTSFTAWLEEEGFQVFSALNSAEACKILDNETIEAVLLDFRLGTENGLSVARTLKQADEYVKIIIITGYPSYNMAVESIKSGMFDYLSKDESGEKIVETLKKAIRAREMEILKGGQTLPGEPFLKFIALCNHSLIKERLGNFSSHYPDFKLMKTFSSLKELINTSYVPEIDIVMICATCCLNPFNTAFVFFHELYKIIPTARPVIFNEYFSEKEKVDLIRIGARGFFSIEMDSETLEKALSLIKKGEMWTSRKLASLALPSGPEYLKDIIAGRESYGLSSREKDILKAIVCGLKNNEIADRLFISENTVKTHINKIYKKFSVKNRAQAICFALEKKILQQ
jgi:DNA-binding NarL/FixJ family response regulator